MRICLITPELPPYSYGGIGRYVLTLARELGRAGHVVTVAGFRIHPQPVVTHTWGRSVALTHAADSTSPLVWPLHAAARGLSRVEERLRQSTLPFVWRFTHLWYLRRIAAAALAVRRYLSAHGSTFDVIEMSNYPGHGAFAPDVDVPYVVRLSTPASEGGSFGNVYLPVLERRTCAKARRLIAHSKAIRDKAEQLYGVRDDNIAVIPIGLEDVTIPSDERRDTDSLIISYCGRAERRKGTDLLLRALARVLPANPRLSIRLIGGDVDAYAASQESLRTIWNDVRRRCGHQIESVGTVEDADRDRLLASSDWSIVPSRFESFGLVAVESMRVGTPVIATDAGGLGEVSRCSPANILCAAESVDALANAIQLACDAGKADARARREVTRGAYLEHFTAQRMTEATLQIYQSATRHAEW